MICPKCGYELEESAVFCTKCGVHLKEDEIQSEVQPQAEDQTLTYEQTQYTEQNQNTPEYSQYEQSQQQYIQYEQSQQHIQYAYQEPYQEMMPTETPGKGLGIASFVIAIICFFFPAYFILPTTGMILGIVGYNKAKHAGIKNEFAFAGMVMCIVRLAQVILVVLLYIVVIIIYFLLFSMILGTASYV